MRIAFGCAVQAQGLFATWLIERWTPGATIVVLEERELPLSTDYPVDRPPFWNIRSFLDKRPTMVTYYQRVGQWGTVEKLMDLVWRIDTGRLTEEEKPLQWIGDLAAKRAEIAHISTTTTRIREMLPSIFAMFDYAWEVFQESETLPVVRPSGQSLWGATRLPAIESDPASALLPPNPTRPILLYRLLDGLRVIVFLGKDPNFFSIFSDFPQFEAAITVHPRARGKPGYLAHIQKQRWSSLNLVLVQDVLDRYGETWVNPTKVDLDSLAPQRGFTTLDRRELLRVIVEASQRQ